MLLLGPVVGLVLAIPFAAQAGHGTWWHHEYHLTYHPGTGSGSAYAHTNAETKVDKSMARLLVYKGGTYYVDTQVQCFPDVGDTCGEQRTATHNFNVFGKTVESHHCGIDSGHTFGNVPSFVQPCAMNALNLDVHKKTY